MSARITCPECEGNGRGGIVAECCGNMTSAGDCCGNAEPAQAPCVVCHGDGMVDAPERPTHYQQLTPEAEVAVRQALEPVPNSTSGYGLGVPEAYESYDCENCPASFGYQPEHFLCPLCHGQLSGKIEINFTPPYPPEPEVPCTVCGEHASLIVSETGYCREHWTAPGVAA